MADIGRGVIYSIEGGRVTSWCRKSSEIGEVPSERKRTYEQEFENINRAE